MTPLQNRTSVKCVRKCPPGDWSENRIVEFLTEVSPHDHKGCSADNYVATNSVAFPALQGQETQTPAINGPTAEQNFRARKSKLYICCK